jgi:hypothetical protein
MLPMLTFIAGKIRGILPYQPAYKYDEVLDPIKTNPSLSYHHNCDSRIHQVSNLSQDQGVNVMITIIDLFRRKNTQK